jgi:translocator assembly and maintenance protein 41
MTLLPVREFTKALSQMPSMRYAIAYGSGAVRQKGYSDADQAKTMVDFVLAVDDSETWHRDNLAANPHHYSGAMRLLGAGAVHKVQQLGAGVYYNPMVTWDTETGTQRLMKYGVIETSTLKADLVRWDSMYVAGRMHKPHLVVQHDAEVAAAADLNLINAVRTALLLLPPSFDEKALYTQIAGLSYAGDVRTVGGVGENPNKVSNIVSANVAGFREHFSRAMGHPSLRSQVQTASTDSEGHGSTGEAAETLLHFEQDTSVQARRELVRHLPLGLKAGLPDGGWEPLGAVARIVRRSSVHQTIKGIFTAGAVKSASYALAKVRKASKSA